MPLPSMHPAQPDINTARRAHATSRRRQARPQATFRGGTDIFPSDAFVAKINAAGTAFDYVTYLGGSTNIEQAFGVAVDSAGQAYVTGYAESDDFPTTSGAFQRAIGPSRHDGFLAKLDGGGAALLYATFFGANSPRPILRASPSTRAATRPLTGRTFAGNVPVSPGATPWSRNGQGDGFLVKFEPTGASATFGSYIGGAAADAATSVAVDGKRPRVRDRVDAESSGGDLRETGTHSSGSWIQTETASPFVFATQFGGSLDDTGVAVAVDPAGNAVVAVETESSDFPTTASGSVTHSALVRILLRWEPHSPARRTSGLWSRRQRCRGQRGRPELQRLRRRRPMASREGFKALG